MSKTGRHIVDNEIDVTPDVDDSSSENFDDRPDSYWEEQAEKSGQDNTYRRMVEIGKADI